MLALLLVAAMLGLWASRVQAVDLALPPSAAALVLEAGRPPAPGTVVRCTGDQQVGLLVTDAMAMDLRGVTVENCPVGLLYDAPAPPPDESAALLQRQAGTGTVSGLTVTGPRCLAGFWNRGPRVIVQENILGECDYGIVAGSTEGLYVGNIITRSRRDGILVLGTHNVLRGNQIDASGRYGIHLAALAPQFGRGLLLPRALLHRSIGNTIEGNVVTRSGWADLRQWPFAAGCADLENVWQGNTVRKVSPRCLQDPPPPEEEAADVGN